ncbi:hypothetical protein H6P81_006777 [Aristolochia fimbriata]|uniref:Uncharacterized protein n=1 Tax=Aristolochia fimbriata TaxID=158543 RepID=A0AAV7F2S9_ARIFI|nr:hypothetical protein H6P81_006777 [Aristolochia fimbriata]
MQLVISTVAYMVVQNVQLWRVQITVYGGHKEKFVRLDDLDSTTSFSSEAAGMNICGFSVEELGRGRKSSKPTKSFRKGMRKGSERLMSIGRTIKFGVSKAVFAEDLKVSEKKIYNPQDKFLQGYLNFSEAPNHRNFLWIRSKFFAIVLGHEIRDR